MAIKVKPSDSPCPSCSTVFVSPEEVKEHVRLGHFNYTDQPVKLSRVTATRFVNTWAATVHDGLGYIGYGQASEWLVAMNAAIEDLKEKKDKNKS